MRLLVLYSWSLSYALSGKPVGSAVAAGLCLAFGLAVAVSEALFGCGDLPVTASELLYWLAGQMLMCFFIIQPARVLC